MKAKDTYAYDHFGSDDRAKDAKGYGIIDVRKGGATKPTTRPTMKPAKGKKKA